MSTHGTPSFTLKTLTLAVSATLAGHAFAFVDNSFNASEVKTTTIHSIQKQSKTGYKDNKFVQSPIEGDEFTVEGVVTAKAPLLNIKDFSKTQVCNGVYFIQTPDQQTQDPEVSDGLMICNNDLKSQAVINEVKIGDAVQITGTAHEVYNETQLRIDSIDDTKVLSGEKWTANTALFKTDITLAQAHDLYEGMSVKLPANTWYVTDHYNFGRYGELQVSKDAPLWKPTNLYPAESDKAIAEQKKNDESKLVITNGISKQNYPEFTYYEAFDKEHPIRLGNTIENTEGVVRYAYKKVQVMPMGQIAFADGISPRNDAPARKAEDLRVASMNVLNYFNGRYNEETGKFDYSKSDAKDGNGQYHGSRGAKTEELFNRQRDKIINAIAEMDADIVGLMEIENDGFGEHSAIADLVNGVNKKLEEKGKSRRYTGQLHQF